MKARVFWWIRFRCWWSGHRWAIKSGERFCFRCGERQTYTVLPGGRARGSGRWLDENGDDA